jgi:PIN domain nuclease of toxin-antitoxin system
VKVLLDTNALLWFLGDNKRLAPSARRAIERATILQVSEMSLLEISVKVSTGKLPAQPRLHEVIRNSGMQRTGISDAYLARLESLPLIHRDPFDRLLIAQALIDDLTVVTSDPIFAKYGVRVIDAQA